MGSPESARVGRSRDTIDVGHIIDHGPWSAYQRRVLLLAAIAGVLDGFDLQSLSLAIPALMAEWSVTRSDFAPVLSIGLIGMASGTALGGTLGDRFGRKPALIGSILVFGLATTAMGFAADLRSLLVLRFIAGLGMGGALPNATMLVAEFTPLRRRSLAVTLIIASVGIGGVLGGFAGALLLPTVGWRALFLIGGTLAVAFGLTQLAVLPESPRYLLRQPRRRPAVAALLARMGHPTSADAQLVDEPERKIAHVPLRSVLEREYRRDTLALWATFFFALLSLHCLVTWVPSMLHGVGFDLAVSSAGLAYFNVGCIAGALAGGWTLDRMGSRVPLLALAGGAVLAAAALAVLPLGPAEGVIALMVLLAFAGACIGGLQSSLYVVGAHVYPTSIRATGVGGAVGVGRLGTVISPFVGAAALAQGGGSAFFALLGAFMSVSFAALLLIRRHVPRPPR